MRLSWFVRHHRPLNHVVYGRDLGKDLGERCTGRGLQLGWRNTAHRERCCSVAGKQHAISANRSFARCRITADISCNAGDVYGIDAARPEDQIEIRIVKGSKARLVEDNVGGCYREVCMQVCPLRSLEQ